MLKRVFDLMLSLTGLILSAPLWFLIGLAIWLEDRGGIFYVQERFGLDGRVFKGIKFRSMRRGAEDGIGPVQARENDPRVTRVGRLLRLTALDELPQLVNILKGDMSFVGPRALRPEETEVSAAQSKKLTDYPEFQARCKVRPGLTGVAQVSASRSMPREGKFKYDLWYIDNRSFWLDIKLILRSFLNTFTARWDR